MFQIHVARKRQSVRTEAGLVAAVVLLRHIVPLLSDRTFYDILQVLYTNIDQTLVNSLHRL